MAPQVAERLADLPAQEQLGRTLLLVAARVQVLVGLGHQPDRRPGRLRGHDRADPREVLRAGGDVVRARPRAAAVGGLDRVPVHDEDVGHPRGPAVADHVEMRDVTEDRDDGVGRIGLVVGGVDRADLGRAQAVPRRLLDGQVAVQRRVVLHEVDPVGHPRRVDPAELVVDRLGERHDHLEAAPLRRVEIVDGVVRPGGALHDGGEAAVADPAVVRGDVGQRDVLQDHRHRVALGGDGSARAEQRGRHHGQQGEARGALDGSDAAADEVHALTMAGGTSTR